MESLVADYGSSSNESEDLVSSPDSPSQPTAFQGDLFRAGLFGCTDENDFDTPNNNFCNDTDENLVKHLPRKHEPTTSKLPKPSFNSTVDELSGVTSGVSVFANPFKAAEEAQKSLLEKHVKMTSDTKQSQVINGKQVCWNYRKGRCRFGHNCKFAHDSDLPAPMKKPVVETVEKPLEEHHTIVRQPHHVLLPTSAVEDPDDATPHSGKKKRKCGLGDSLIPSKKVIKMHHKHSKEPWTS